MSEQEFAYIGDELTVFSKATNWKKYWGSKIRPYLGNTVLEVGAGIGGTTSVLIEPSFRRWLAIEPDGDMVRDLQARQQAGEFPANCEFMQATTADLSSDQLFDSAIYIDVLEHIEKDAAEVQRAVTLVKPGGYVIVLSPAFQYLYTEFDAAIGHYRRYTRKSIQALTPDGARVQTAFYLDAVGCLASLGNKILLKSSTPNDRQIWMWDRLMVPLSRVVVDRLVGYSFGRSVVCVWRRV